MKRYFEWAKRLRDWAVLRDDSAGQHNICPFELSLDLSLWVDGVICDYNYVFDPRVYLKRFFNENAGEYCFLIDEAHNLVDRAREMFSAELTKQPFLELKRLLKTALPKVAKTVGGIRTESDKGVVVLIDERFAAARYKRLFPKNGVELLVLEMVGKFLE